MQNQPPETPPQTPQKLEQGKKITRAGLPKKFKGIILQKVL